MNDFLMQKLTCVLLVDDDDVTNFVHESLIDEMSITDKVLEAKNGRKALDLIQQEELRAMNCPSLILLDINMPVMNGFEFLEAYQQFDEELKQAVIIVMLTSSLNPKDVERAKNSGVAEFLDKPLTEEKLKRVLEKYF